VDLSDRPRPASDGLPLTGLPRVGLPERVLVVGDPFRVNRIAERLEEPELVAHVREYRTVRGRWRGVEVAVASHGVGGPGAMCLFQELASAGARTVVRLGTCGSMQPGVADGDLVIATGAVRDDGVTDQMVPLAYPAVATAEVVGALVAAAGGPGAAAVHRGVVWSRAAFFAEMVELPMAGYAAHGVVAIEMEVAALLVLASLRGQAAGALLVVDGSAVDQLEGEAAYDPTRAAVTAGIERAMVVALDALTSR
jgi:uridine phosphorylase